MLGRRASPGRRLTRIAGDDPPAAAKPLQKSGVVRHPRPPLERFGRSDGPDVPLDTRRAGFEANP
jgi:hypothetical protein